MLILSRKIGQTITIGSNITVKVLTIQEGCVKIGIEAPREIPIYRTELYEEIQQQNAKAASAARTSAAAVASKLAHRTAGTGSGDSKPSGAVGG